MARPILISDTEFHPLKVPKDSVLRKGDNEKPVLFIGLHNSRGANVVFSTRVTDSFFDVVSKNGLTYTRNEPDKKMIPSTVKLEVYKRFGLEMDIVGVAYNVRKTWKEADYQRLVEEIADSLE